MLMKLTPELERGAAYAKEDKNKGKSFDMGKNVESVYSDRGVNPIKYFVSLKCLIQS